MLLPPAAPSVPATSDLQPRQRPEQVYFMRLGISGHTSDDRSLPPTVPGMPSTSFAFVCRQTSGPFAVMPPVCSIRPHYAPPAALEPR